MAPQPYSERMALNSPKGRAGRPITNAETARIAERRAEVAALLLEHRTYREMAQRLDCSAATIAEDVKAVREVWRQRASEDYGAWLAEETAKLDAIEAALLPGACAGDFRAVDRQLALMARRARIHGLDQPEAVAVWQSRQRPHEPEPTTTAARSLT
jgi:DNA-binding CsgD family transcriptional regulator